MSIQNTTPATGMIVLSHQNAPLFVFSKDGQDIGSIRAFAFKSIAAGVTRKTFDSFIRYAERHGAMVRGNNYARCNYATLQLLYQEFNDIREMDFNSAMTAVLAANNIYPPVPEVEGLDFHVVDGNSMLWLKKARGWLLRVFGTKFAPRQMTN